MPRVVTIPEPLTRGPFVAATAEALGVSRAVLRGPRFRTICRGVYLDTRLELTHQRQLDAFLLALPDGTVVSHVSAARLWGFDPTGFADLEFSTNARPPSVLPGVVLHRRQATITAYERAGLPVTGPDRTFVDCALTLSFMQLVQLGDHLVHVGATKVDVLTTYCHERHLHGVQRARRAVGWVRAGSESPRETLVRLLIVFARLPEPELNVWITDADGRRVARADMLYASFNVIVEYDGWQHERDSMQRQRDRERREVLEALGYRLIVITDADLRDPATIPQRVFNALVQRGYTGPAPVTSVMWKRWAANF